MWWLGQLSTAQRMSGCTECSRKASAVSYDNFKKCSCPVLQIHAGGSSSTPYSSVVTGAFKCKTTSSLCCMRQSLSFAYGRVMVMSTTHLSSPSLQELGRLRQSLSSPGVCISVRLERKAWSPGEFVGTGGTGKVRKGPGKFRYKTWKENEAKIKDEHWS